MISMLSFQSLQQSGQMTSHMTSAGNQDTFITVLLILGVVIIFLVAGIIFLLYLFYSGKLSFNSGQKIAKHVESTSNNEENENLPGNKNLPPVSLNPLERKILEVVMNGHNVLQSDLPGLVNSSKSKVSEALSYLEDQKLIQRMKAGRSLTIKYIYKSNN